MTHLISKVLEFSEKNGFLKLKAVNKMIDHFKYFAAGELLSQNIQNEWIYSNIISRDENVFPIHLGKPVHYSVEDLKEPFSFARTLCDDQLPFGLAETRLENISDSNFILHSLATYESKFFSPKKQTLLRHISFLVPTAGQQFFYHWQRHRKIWWRKFSADPGRFSLEETKSTGSDCKDVVNIRAEFPWGLETVEKINNIGTALFEKLPKKDRECFLAKEGKKNVLPHIVESVTSLEAAALFFLCDAYSETNIAREKTKVVMKLHRKLSPYKFSFSAPPSCMEVSDNLNSLSKHICKNLRKAGISILLKPDIGKKSFESQIAKNDGLGIPFTIVLRESTLLDGMVGLRSRETTLEERIHVSNLRDYAELLMKNY